MACHNSGNGWVIAALTLANDGLTLGSTWLDMARVNEKLTIQR